MIYQPETIEDAVQILNENPNTQIIAGGTDFMVEVNFGHRKISNVLSLRNIKSLRSWNFDAGTLHIGACLPYARMESGQIAELTPALAQAARTVGSPQIRAAAGIGGNLGTCSPAGDSLPVLSAHDAAVVIASSTGQRETSIHDFMIGPKRNSLNAGEIVTGVRYAIPTGFQAYSKVGVRNAMVISVASLCLVHDTDSAVIRVALGTVGPTVLRARESESWLKDQIDLSKRPEVSNTLATEFGRRVSAECSPITDHRSTAEYRKHAVSVLASRLLERAGHQ